MRSRNRVERGHEMYLQRVFGAEGSRVMSLSTLREGGGITYGERA